MQKTFKYLLVVLFAMPFALRAESENDVARKGCCGRFKKACVSGLLTAGTFNLCNGGTLNGPVVMNAAPDVVCAGCNRTTRSSCFDDVALTVNGATVLNGPLTENCLATFTNGLNVTGGLTVGGCITSSCINITGATGSCITTPCSNVSGDATVGGNSTVAGGSAVGGNATVGGTLNVAGAGGVTVAGGSAIGGNSTVGGSLTVAGGASISDGASSIIVDPTCVEITCLNVTGDATVIGDLTVSGCINTSCLNYTGAANFANVTVSGDLTVDNCITTSCLNVTESFTLEGQPVSRSGYYFANYPVGSPDWNTHGSTNMATAGNWTITIGTLDNTLENPGASTQIWWYVVGDHSVVTIELAITGGGPLFNAALTGEVDLYAELSNAGAPILAYFTSASQLPQTSSGQPGSGLVGLWTSNVGSLIFPNLSSPLTNLYKIIVQSNDVGATSYNGSMTFTYVT